MKHKPHVIKSNSVSLLISLSIESNRHSRDGKAKPGPIDVNLNISLNEPTQCRVSFMQLSRSPFPGWGRGHCDVRTKSSSHRPPQATMTWPPGPGPYPRSLLPHFADLRYMTIKQYSSPVNPLPHINCAMSAMFISKNRVNKNQKQRLRLLYNLIFILLNFR